MAALPPVHAQTYSDLAAMSVLSRLDPMDHLEAEMTRGRAVSHLAIFADWHAMEPARVVSLVLCTGHAAAPVPFAVLGLSLKGEAGVAQAALLSRDHTKFSRALIAACLLIRQKMPAFCKEHGIRRIEARSWAGHPRAARFLTSSGFRFETSMAGFGPDGTAEFRQFAWTDFDTATPEGNEHV